jgi:hypothetical protein
MNRRDFLNHGMKGLATTAAIGAFQPAARGEAAAGSQTTRAGTEPRLTGSFFDFVHVNFWDAAYWTDTCLHWGEQSWRALIRDMHAIGIDTAICGATAFWGRPLYAGYEKKVGRPLKMGCEDPVGAVVDEADRLGMKLFYGIGFRGRCSQVRDYAGMEKPWPDVWFRWNTAVAEALVERYGNRPSFAGLYISYEIDFHDLHVELYEKLIRQHLRPAVGKVKILASPGNIGREVANLDMLPKMVERTGIDILAPQDYGGRSSDITKALEFATLNARALERVARPLRDIGVSVWANCELFDFEPSPDGRGMCIPGSIERIRKQIALQAPVAEKLICYQYQGIMNRRTELVNIGHPSTDTLYRDYVAYLHEQFSGKFEG